jgi:hypothetical protein
MFRYTLVADGPSDRALVPILDWLIEEHTDEIYQPQFAEHLPPAAQGLRRRLGVAVDLYPCDILFVHRDAERTSLDDREAEIRGSLPEKDLYGVPIVPVRMTEAWLLSDEVAIRIAAGNPNGRVVIELPGPARWHQLPDPKAILRDALKTASELGARRLRKFRPDSLRVRVAELTNDFSRLRALEAFGRVEVRLTEVLADMRLCRRP